jgi:hypothetical protein
VRYTRDISKADEWRSGNDTWNRKSGDCEDYAAAVKDLCKEKGFKADIFVVQSKTTGKAHAVTMGKRNGRVWVSSNGSYKEYQSQEDAKQEMAKDLGAWAPEVEVYKVESTEKGVHRYMKTPEGKI